MVRWLWRNLSRGARKRGCEMLNPSLSLLGIFWWVGDFNEDDTEAKKGSDQAKVERLTPHVGRVAIKISFEIMRISSAAWSFPFRINSKRIDFFFASRLLSFGFDSLGLRRALTKIEQWSVEIETTNKSLQSSVRDEMKIKAKTRRASERAAKWDGSKSDSMSVIKAISPSYQTIVFGGVVCAEASLTIDAHLVCLIGF